MSIFSLDKGGKEHEVFEMRMGERGVSNSYIQTIFDRCCAALENERKITYRKKTWKFELPEPVKDYPIDYVLDGQQRLTSLFSFFQTELKVEEDRDWMNIYYLIGSVAEKQKTSFVALRNEDVARNKQFSLNILFDTVKY